MVAGLEMSFVGKGTGGFETQQHLVATVSQWGAGAKENGPELLGEALHTARPVAPPRQLGKVVEPDSFGGKPLGDVRQVNLGGQVKGEAFILKSAGHCAGLWQGGRRGLGCADRVRLETCAGPSWSGRWTLQGTGGRGMGVAGSSAHAGGVEGAPR